MSTRDLHHPVIRALLGPTNTGKTHAAIRRMLGHRSGMIGLPLRLLAREVYDRISAEIGEEAVALVTGEEKRVPARPRYWVSTTESMPVERPVDFVAVDEIQLVAHRERGHVFTDRLLRARGFRETWFLGSDTAEPIVRALVPTAVIDRAERLSRLSWAGIHPLSGLPRRAAVIAFSMEQVTALAEALRRKHGGVAVVMGALSPRTRNAQVAMYQAGEVPYIVATDAIGMGLNMDIEHVAFASLSKYDGRELRPLSVGELAQIAGRAGRFRRDGTFGTLDEVGELGADQIAAMEMHRFPALKNAFWRNADLDYSSVDALLSSLKRPPPARIFRAAPRGEDLSALLTLSTHAEVRGRASTPARVSLLWDICRLPDFRKTLTEDHSRLLLEIWRQLTSSRGQIEEDWLHAELAPLDQAQGDIDTLMARVQGVRTLTSIVFHGEWVPDTGWQERARSVEDRLSDALHERLVQRFVDRRVMALNAVLSERGGAELGDAGLVRAGGEALGALEGVTFTPLNPKDREGWKAARQTLGDLIARRVDALVEAPHEAIHLDAAGALRWEGGRLGRWVAGDQLERPMVRLDDLPLVPPGARLRVQRRLVAWSRDAVSRAMEPLGRPAAAHLSAPGKGLVFMVGQALGTLPRAAAERHLAALSPSDRRPLAALGLRLGSAFLYVSDLLTPEAVLLRGLLWTTFHGLAPLALPAEAAWAPVEEPAREQAWLAAGFPVIRGRALRVDVLERALARLRAASRAGASEPPPEIAAWFSLPEAELPELAASLGFGAPAPRRPPRPPPRSRR